jgi:hypothetical protein
MKKVIGILMMLVSFSAFAVDVGVKDNHDYSTHDRSSYGISVGQKFGAYGVTASFDDYTKNMNQKKFSVIGSYDVTKFGQASVAVKGGVAYLDNKRAQDGYAGVAGVGVSYPVMNKVSVTADLMRQYGQDKVQSFDGNKVSVGLKYSF